MQSMLRGIVSRSALLTSIVLAASASPSWAYDTGLQLYEECLSDYVPAKLKTRDDWIRVKRCENFLTASLERLNWPKSIPAAPGSAPPTGYLTDEEVGLRPRPPGSVPAARLLSTEEMMGTAPAAGSKPRFLTFEEFRGLPPGSLPREELCPPHANIAQEFIKFIDGRGTAEPGIERPLKQKGYAHELVKKVFTELYPRCASAGQSKP